MNKHWGLRINVTVTSEHLGGRASITGKHDPASDKCSPLEARTSAAPPAGREGLRRGGTAYDQTAEAVIGSPPLGSLTRTNIELGSGDAPQMPTLRATLNKRATSYTAA
jgi:hypothetical protein